MNHYDANQLTKMLEGAMPLQSLAGEGGVIAQNMAALGLEMDAPKPQPQPEMAPSTPDMGWNPILKGHGL